MLPISLKISGESATPTTGETDGWPGIEGKLEKKFPTSLVDLERTKVGSASYVEALLGIVSSALREDVMRVWT